jgi:hypothetical protein
MQWGMGHSSGNCLQGRLSYGATPGVRAQGGAAAGRRSLPGTRRGWAWQAQPVLLLLLLLLLQEPGAIRSRSPSPRRQPAGPSGALSESLTGCVAAPRRRDCRSGLEVRLSPSPFSHQMRSDG